MSTSTFTVRKAVRKNLPLKVLVSGYSGTGKTYSSLLLAKGLVGGDGDKVVVIDTENCRSEFYSHLVGHQVVHLDKPYHPARYAEAIKQLEKQFPCIIIDSASHEWEGIGGCLDLSKAKSGGKHSNFQDWAMITPLHQQFCEAILHSPSHIIATCRRKQEYSMEGGDEGRKSSVRKVGTKIVQRDNFEYDFTVVFDVHEDHRALATKDNTGLFQSEMPFFLTEELGSKLREWNETGKEAPITDNEASALWTLAKNQGWTAEQWKEFFKLEYGLTNSKLLGRSQLQPAQTLLTQGPALYFKKALDAGKGAA